MLEKLFRYSSHESESDEAYYLHQASDAYNLLMSCIPENGKEKLRAEIRREATNKVFLQLANLLYNTCSTVSIVCTCMIMKL